MTLSPTLKFAFVVGCFTIALLSGFKCNNKRDWLWLVAGLAFTVAADFFLVLRNEHILGVAVFCFTHICYIFRGVSRGGGGWFSLAALRRCSAGVAFGDNALRGARESARRKPTAPSLAKDVRVPPYFRASRLIIGTCCVFVIIWAVAVAISSVIVLAALYAALFAVNIYVNYKNKTNRPKINYYLVMVGLVLFALCDINVMLFNLSQYTNLDFDFEYAFKLIWVFYLPSQVLLALSALRFNRILV